MFHVLRYSFIDHVTSYQFKNINTNRKSIISVKHWKIFWSFVNLKSNLLSMPNSSNDIANLYYVKDLYLIYN